MLSWRGILTLLVCSCREFEYFVRMDSDLLWWQLAFPNLRQKLSTPRTRGRVSVTSIAKIQSVLVALSRQYPVMILSPAMPDSRSDHVIMTWNPHIACLLWVSVLWTYGFRLIMMTTRIPQLATKVVKPKNSRTCFSNTLWIPTLCCVFESTMSR